MAVMLAYFYNYPNRKMKVIGITETNGKTTTFYILEKLREDYFLNVGLMGNIGKKIKGGNLSYGFKYT
jgi:UDP-N-acetylmuramyl tripeptide synthase